MAARATVLHGVDQSGLSTARPTRAHWGHLFFDTDLLAYRVWDETGIEWWPVEYVAFKYDVTGGDDGTIGPHGLAGTKIPAGTIILDGIIDVITTFTSAGDTATIAISIQSANDIVSAVAINDGANPWDAGLHAIVPDGAAANAIKATADRDVRITVATQDLTAGKLRGFLRCVRSEQTVVEEESSSSSSSSNSSSSSSNSSSSSSSNSSSSSSSNSSSSSSP